MSDTPSNTSVAEPKAQTQPKTKPNQKVEKLPPYNVVLLNDEEHTYEYVVEMLGRIFGYNEQKAYKMAQEVDSSGRVIVATTHKEKAEMKRDQITSYGADPRIAACRGAMSAIIEPAEAS